MANDFEMMQRRRFLKWGLGVVGAWVTAPAWSGVAGRLLEPKRRLSLYNTHTGERLSAVYWAEGDYLPSALAEINHVLRDHRSGEVAAMDPQLLDVLFALSCRLDCERPFEIISGYRSPVTNAMLAAQSEGVAKKSLHTQGRAVDIRIAGLPLDELRQAALSLRRGGVGYYPRSNFIHVDTGRVRTW